MLCYAMQLMFTSNDARDARCTCNRSNIPPLPNDRRDGLRCEHTGWIGAAHVRGNMKDARQFRVCLPCQIFPTRCNHSPFQRKINWRGAQNNRCGNQENICDCKYSSNNLPAPVHVLLRGIFAGHYGRCSFDDSIAGLGGMEIVEYIETLWERTIWYWRFYSTLDGEGGKWYWRLVKWMRGVCTYQRLLAFATLKSTVHHVWGRRRGCQQFGAWCSREDVEDKAVIFHEADCAERIRRACRCPSGVGLRVRHSFS